MLLGVDVVVVVLMNAVESLSSLDCALWVSQAISAISCKLRIVTSRREKLNSES